MPELKRPLESSDSTSLVLAKKPRNELVQVTERSKALVESVSYGSRYQSVYLVRTLISRTKWILEFHQVSYLTVDNQGPYRHFVALRGPSWPFAALWSAFRPIAAFPSPWCPLAVLCGPLWPLAALHYPLWPFAAHCSPWRPLRTLPGPLWSSIVYAILF